MLLNNPKKNQRYIKVLIRKGNAWRSKQSRARLQVTDLDKNVCVLNLLEDFKLEYPKSENEYKYLKKKYWREIDRWTCR